MSRSPVSTMPAPATASLKSGPPVGGNADAAAGGMGAAFGGAGVTVNARLAAGGAGGTAP